MKLIFATNNSHKLAEARSILSSSCDIAWLSDIGCTDQIDETADTIEGNSLLKARYLWQHYQQNCFADDTGLEVEALAGAPGVKSARYAGEAHNDALNRHKLLEAMQGVNNRKARFRTVLTLIIDGKEVQVEGIINGQIVAKESGNNGFGYDSVFIPDGYDLTFAELTEKEKNRISHRRKALDALKQYLKTNH